MQRSRCWKRFSNNFLPLPAAVCGERAGERGKVLEESGARCSRESLAPLPCPLPGVPGRGSRIYTSAMPLFTKTPGNFYVAHNATIVGDVRIGELCSFWFSAVVRGDVAPVT